MQLKKIHGKTYVLGLTWSAIKTKKDRIKAIKGLKYPMYIERAGLIGVANTTKNAIVLALQDYLLDDFVAIFHLHDKNYYLLIHTDKQFDVMGDVIGHKDQIVKLASLYRDTHKIIAPPELEFVGSEYIELEDFVPKKIAKGSHLKKGGVKHLIKNSLWVLFLIVIGFYAFVQYQNYQHTLSKEKIELAHEKLLQLQNQNQKVDAWSLLPLGESLAKQCQSAWGKLPLYISNWEFQSATCSNNSLSVTYKAQSDTSSEANFKAETGQKVQFNNGLASFTIALQKPATGYADEKLTTLTQTQDALSGVLSQAGINLTINNSAYQLLTASNVTPFSFSTQYQPMALLALLPTVGIRLTSLGITLTGVSVNYTYKGNIYHD